MVSTALPSVEAIHASIRKLATCPGNNHLHAHLCFEMQLASVLSQNVVVSECIYVCVCICIQAYAYEYACEYVFVQICMFAYIYSTGYKGCHAYHVLLGTYVRCTVLAWKERRRHVGMCRALWLHTCTVMRMSGRVPATLKMLSRLCLPIVVEDGVFIDCFMSSWVIYMRYTGRTMNMRN